MAAVTDQHTLRCWEQHKFLNFENQMSKMVSLSLSQSVPRADCFWKL